MDSYEVSFKLILHAGNSKAKSLLAIEKAREFNFRESEKLVNDAQEELRKAHATHKELIQKEASGEGIEVSLLLVHAQDHLSMAITELDHANEFINIYKILNKLITKGVE